MSAGFVYGNWTEGGGAALIDVSGYNGNWLYPVDAAGTVRVEGPLGDTIVLIDGGAARIVSSPCRNQLCVAAPPIRRHGQWTACLPNQVMVSVENKSAPSDGVDITTW